MESLKEKTARGLFWGGLSNGMQQLLNLAFGIFLARILNSSDYGMVGMLGIFIAIAGIIQESGFTAALTNKQDAGDKDYNAVFWFSTLTGATMYAILFFCAPLIANFFGHEELKTLSRVVFLGFFISSTGTAHNALFFKQMRAKEMAKISVISLAISGCVGVALAFCDMGYWSLAFQTLSYITSTTLLRWYYSPWRPSFHIDFRPLKGMYAFSFKILLTNIVGQVSGNMFSAILGKFYTPSAVGYYTQSGKWMFMGMQTINGMVSGIALPAFAEVGMSDKERLRRVQYSMLRFASFVSFPILMGLALVAPEFITITIGEKWLPAVPILRLLCIQGMMWPINNVYSALVISQKRSDIVFWNGLVFGLVQIAVALVMFRFGILWMVAVYASCYVLLTVVWQFTAKRIIGFTHTAALYAMVPYMGCSIVVLGIAYYATLSITNVYLLGMAKIVISVVLYVGVMKAFHSKVLDEGLAFIKKHKGKR